MLIMWSVVMRGLCNPRTVIVIVIVLGDAVRLKCPYKGYVFPCGGVRVLV